MTTLGDRLNQIIAEQKITNTESAKQVAPEFGYDGHWIMAVEVSDQ